jgi:hypothetical protein
MKPIEKSELYQHVNEFLKTKGVEIKDGTYARHLEKSCGLLTDAINLTQKGMERAKSEIDKRLEQMRQVIHEKTAPKTSAQPPPRPRAATQQAAPPKTAARKAAESKRRNSEARRRVQSGKSKPSKNAKGK